MKAAGFEVRSQIIWAKNTFAWRFGRYKCQYEPIFYAHVAGRRILGSVGIESPMFVLEPTANCARIPGLVVNVQVWGLN